MSWLAGPTTGRAGRFWSSGRAGVGTIPSSACASAWISSIFFAYTGSDAVTFSALPSVPDCSRNSAADLRWRRSISVSPWQWQRQRNAANGSAMVPTCKSKTCSTLVQL